MSTATISPDISDKMTQTVRESLEVSRPFSAYNITLWTRDKNKLRLRHQDIVGVVHELDLLKDALDYGYVIDGGSTITWVRSTFTNWNGPAFEVYHPVGYDISQFVPEGVQPASPAEVQSSQRPVNMIGLVTPLPDGTQPDAGGPQPDGTVKSDYASRLMVCTKYFREAGIEPGDIIYVAVDPSNQRVVVGDDSAFSVIENLTYNSRKVERNGDMRLASSTLKAADIIDSKFQIEIKDGLHNNVPFKYIFVTKAV